MKLVFRVIFLLLIFTAGVFALEKTLVWSDEFDYSGLPDSTKWGYDVGGGGWGNNELEYYTEKRTENARVGDGCLTIEARKETFENRQYTSARLVTRGKGDWLYGRIEVRAMLPRGRGLWPAIWMLPTEWAYGDWPKSGEIDIMENVGYDPQKIHCTVHTESFNHTLGTQKSGTIDLPDPHDTYHIYAVEWFEDRIDYFVDDDAVFTFKNENSGYKTWPFNKEFHLVLNVAVGGSWGGAQGVDDAVFPQKMTLDYVRVFSFSGGGPFTVSVASSGKGSVKVVPEQELYELGTEVSIIAQPEKGFEFSGFTGNISGRADTTRIIISKNIQATALFVPEGEMVRNGDFSLGSSFWLPLGNYEGGYGQGSVVDGEYQVQITNAGTQDWQIQFDQEGMELLQGKTYTLSFDAYSESGRSINAALNMCTEPFTTYAKKAFSLTTQKTRYTLTFTMNEQTDNNARVEFDLGLSTADVYLDNVSLIFNDLVYINSYRVDVRKTGSLQYRYFYKSKELLFTNPERLPLQFRLFNLKGEEIILFEEARNGDVARTVNLGRYNLTPGTYAFTAAIKNEKINGRIMVGE